MTCRLSTVLVAVFVLAAVSPALGADADAIYFGGPIVTVDDRQPSAEAVAVKDGRIVAVGSRRDVESVQKGRSTRMVDLAGRTMIPGFIDAHGHMWGAGVQAMAANLLPPPDGPVRSIADLQAQLRQWMATSNIARDFGVVIGFGYDDSQLVEQRHPCCDRRTRPAYREVIFSLQMFLAGKYEWTFGDDAKSRCGREATTEGRALSGPAAGASCGRSLSPGAVISTTAWLRVMPLVNGSRSDRSAKGRGLPGEHLSEFLWVLHNFC